MSKKSRFRGLIEKQHRKRAEPLFKPVLKHLYQIDWSLSSQLNYKKSLFLTCQILGLLCNILAAEERNPFLNRDNLTIPFQMQLSQNQKPFSECFAWFLKPTINLKDFGKTMTIIDFVFPKLRTPKTFSDKYLKSPVCEDLSIADMVNVPKHCWNLYRNTFMIFFYHCEVS